MTRFSINSLTLSILAINLIFSSGLSFAEIKISAADTATLNIYSARKENLIKPLLTEFQKETGIHVNLITGKADALLVRIKSEGEKSPADILLTSDAGRLYRAKSAGLLHCVTNDVLKNNIPEKYRDPDNCWIALSLRARVFMMSKSVTESTRDIKQMPTSYESLAEPKWRHKICIRSSNNIYNQSLVASMIAAHGEKDTLQWLRGLVKNFARNPVGGDRDQIIAMANGLCDIAIANTYYLAMMAQSNIDAHKIVADSVTVLWPNQSGRGVHINISGAGIIRTAPHKNNAIKLLEYMTQESAQQWFAQHNYEYPLRTDVPVPTKLQSWGKFKADPIALEKLGEFNALAVKLMDQAGWK